MTLVKIGHFSLFLAAGGIAALANFGSRIVLSFHMPFLLAICVAFCIGLSTAFILNRVFVFKRVDSPLHHQISWFVVVNALALLQTILISFALGRYIFPAVGMRFHPETIAHGIGVIFPVFTSYFAHKQVTFRSSSK